MILFLALFGLLMMFPMLYVTLSSFKPYHELWIFPPRLFPASPTLENYSQLFAAMSDSFIPLSRYFVNSLLVTVVGTIGHILVASMCAYPLSQYRFPGSKLIFSLIVTSLMFSSTVTAIPSYMVMNKIGLIRFYVCTDPAGCRRLFRAVPDEAIYGSDDPSLHTGERLHRWRRGNDQIFSHRNANGKTGMADIGDVQRAGIMGHFQHDVYIQ